MKKVIIIVAYDNYRVEKISAKQKFNKLISIFASKNYTSEENTCNFKYLTIVLAKKSKETVVTEQIKKNNIVKLQNAKRQDIKYTYLIQHTYLNCIKYPSQYTDFNIATSFNEFLRLMYMLELKYGFILAILNYFQVNYDIHDNHYIFRYTANTLYYITEQIVQSLREIGANEDDVQALLHNMKIELYCWHAEDNYSNVNYGSETIQSIFVKNLNRYGSQAVAHVLAKNIAICLSSNPSKDDLYHYSQQVYQSIINFKLNIKCRKYIEYLDNNEYKKFLSYCHVMLTDYQGSDNNEIEIFVCGKNKSKTSSFLHYLTYDFNSKDEKQKKETTLLFQTWNDTPSKTINYIIPIRINNSQNELKNNLLSSGAFLFSSQLELLLNNNDDYNLYLIDDEIYIKPNIENETIYGLVLDIGLKIFDLAKKETKSILYPGKKHIINDYFISSDNKNIIFACEDRKIYIYDKIDGKSLISRPNKMEINQVCEGSSDGKKFYGYSDEDYTLYLYDIRNFNQFVDVIKQDIEITKMIYNRACQNLFFLEFGSEAIISIDNIKQESIYESHKIIKDFGFQEQQKFMNIITEDNSINIISL